jgi:hypothetical protein
MPLEFVQKDGTASLALAGSTGGVCWKVVALETRKLSCKCPAVGCMAAQLSVRQREG